MNLERGNERRDTQFTARGGRRSTTTSTINGDHAQPIWNKWRYRAEHRRRHAIENRIPFHTEISWPPKVNTVAAKLPDLEEIGSPSRMLCDLFWMALDWRRLARLLGSIRIHDLGCGSGRYAARLRRNCPEPMIYSGYDVKAHSSWLDNSNAVTSFATFDGSDFASTFSSRPTLCISQSALEHIPEDMRYFDAVSEYANTVPTLLQIHMIPGATCLRQYDLHGLRQYTRDNIRMIADTAPATSRVSLFCLGDQRFADMHVKYVEQAKLLRRSNRDMAGKERYMAEFKTLLDAPSPSGADEAVFLCLVIATGLPELTIERTSTAFYGARFQRLPA